MKSFIKCYKFLLMLGLSNWLGLVAMSYSSDPVASSSKDYYQIIQRCPSLRHQMY